ncbi:MAG: alpha/beta hydrolase [Thermodesulfobacteriota bacterium]
MESLPGPLFFLPGWGFDQRVLSLLPGAAEDALPWQALSSFCRPELGDMVIEAIKAAGEPHHLVGWSMGANLALDLASRQPELVRSLTLVGLRRCWPKPEVAAIGRGLKADMAAFMTDFYRKCFLGNRPAYTKFIRRLEDDYLADLDLPLLLAGLDYLAGFTLPVLPPGLPVRLVHGRKDVIAPLAELPSLPGAKVTVVAGAGHFPFTLEF